MNKRNLILIGGVAAAVLLLTAMLAERSGAGRGAANESGRHKAAPTEAATVAQGGDEKAVYYCPMHTHYRTDKPGNCPICQMQLVKLEKPAPAATQPEGHAGHGAHTAAAGGGAAMPAAAETIFISPERQQLVGVKTVAATVRPLAKEIRAVGKVAFDERKLTHIHTKVSGYVEAVYVDFVGKAVKRGDPMFTLYSPEMVSTQQEYLIARRGQSYLKDSPVAEAVAGANSLAEAARERLRLWDVSEEELARLEKEGTVKRALTIHSPVDGIVTDRMAYHHGRTVNPEMDLYTIVDLTTVWVLAEVYEYELPFVKEGQAAEVEFPYAAGAKMLRGTVTFIYPYLNAKTRTAQVRLEFANTEMALRPDMFVNVKLRSSLGRQLVVPEDAVLDTGKEQYVFVDRGEGVIEPRAVKVGGEAEGFIAIRSGLKAGERVVTAANFLLDSESRLKGALANLGTPSAHEHGQAAAANLSVDVLGPKEAKVGRNTVRLRIRDMSGNAVEDAQVEVMLSMPQMGSMPPMSAKATLRQKEKGEYTGEVEIPVAWTWQMTATVRKGNALLGTVQTTLTVR